jgi:anaphase-promoting complex subunit 1
MAAIRSLGVHSPSGLPYLISEGVLPEDPPQDSYTWETYYDPACESLGFEELLSTETCVVWSRGGVVRKVFNFDVEQQKVQQAVLTWFPSDDGGLVRRRDESPTKRRRLSPEDGPQPTSTPEKSRARALVVFLKLQAHVYFLSGASHVVNLPFEVEKAFPAPRGLILQRKLPPQVIPATPIPPSAPNNSFFSPLSTRRSQPTSSLRVDHEKLPGSSAWPGLDFNLLRSPAEPVTDNLPRHYSFTDPLSEMGLIVCEAPPQPKSVVSRGISDDKTVDVVSKDEELLYVSPLDEIPVGENDDDTPLILLVTANYEKRIFSLWYGSYIGSKPVATLFTGRTTPASGTKTRRRSSFIPTGASTPALRGRDSIRESFGGPGRSKTGPSSMTGSQLGQSQGSQSAEDALASQLDPDYERRQPAAKESRRVSSLLSRAELSTSFDRNAFNDLATHHGGPRDSLGGHSRRGHSLGTSQDRLSFGLSQSQRKLRASTPGSFSRLSIDDASDTRTILGGRWSQTLLDDDDLDEAFNGYPLDDELDLHQPIDGLKKEFYMSKFAELSMGQPARSVISSQQSNAGDRVSLPFRSFPSSAQVDEDLEVVEADTLP